METARVAIGADDLVSRIRQRVTGLGETSRRVIWSRRENRALIYGDTLSARLLRGWLLVSLDVETDQTGRRTLELVFFLGGPGQAEGNTAAVRINAASPEATELAEVWGEDLQRVIWDAVLDAIQVALRAASGRHPKQTLTLRGFQATPDALLVDVIAGDL